LFFFKTQRAKGWELIKETTMPGTSIVHASKKLTQRASRASSAGGGNCFDNEQRYGTLRSRLSLSHLAQLTVAEINQLGGSRLRGSKARACVTSRKRAGKSAGCADDHACTQALVDEDGPMQLWQLTGATMLRPELIMLPELTATLQVSDNPLSSSAWHKRCTTDRCDDAERPDQRNSLMQIVVGDVFVYVCEKLRKTCARHKRCD
jgi:hypothetical protein